LKFKAILPDGDAAFCACAKLNIKSRQRENKYFILIDFFELIKVNKIELYQSIRFNKSIFFVTKKTLRYKYQRADLK
jgi:hypothetical protein